MKKRNSGSTPASDEKPGQVIDGQTGKPVPSPRRIDLSTLRDVRLEMAHLYRQVDAGELETQDGTRRVYMLRQIADVISIAELETRLTELEEQHAQRLAGSRALPYQPATH
jgi:hypothetical protein